MSIYLQSPSQSLLNLLLNQPDSFTDQSWESKPRLLLLRFTNFVLLPSLTASSDGRKVDRQPDTQILCLYWYHLMNFIHFNNFIIMFMFCFAFHSMHKVWLTAVWQDIVTYRASITAKDNCNGNGCNCPCLAKTLQTVLFVNMNQTWQNYKQNETCWHFEPCSWQTKIYLKRYKTGREIYFLFKLIISFIYVLCCTIKCRFKRTKSREVK